MKIVPIIGANGNNYMKSLNRRFAEVQEKRPGCSSIVNMSAAVKDGRFTPRVVSYWFNRLVEKDDFTETDRRDILKHLNALSGAEDGRKRRMLPLTRAPKLPAPVSVLTHFAYAQTIH